MILMEITNSETKPKKKSPRKSLFHLPCQPNVSIKTGFTKINTVKTTICEVSVKYKTTME